MRLTTLPPSCSVVIKSGNLNFQEPSGPLQACNGTALPYYYYYYYMGRSAPGVFVISLLGSVAVGLMKVGSRVTDGRRGVSCKIDKPWLVHGSECVFTCGVV